MRRRLHSPWILLAALAIAGCSADLHETEGPIVPFPNVTGRVLTEGLPAVDRKVKLIETATDTEIDSDRTGPDGIFAFTQVPSGAWTLEAGGTGEEEFDAVTIDFEISADGDGFDAPDMDLALRGLRAIAPAPGAVQPLPSLSTPILFEWERPDTSGATIQVRLYGPAGESIWHSVKTEDSSVRWNGIANRGESAGLPVPPGSYTWKLREEPDAGAAIERTTAALSVVFEEPRR